MNLLDWKGSTNLNPRTRQVHRFLIFIRYPTVISFGLSGLHIRKNKISAHNYACMFEYWESLLTYFLSRVFTWFTWPVCSLYHDDTWKDKREIGPYSMYVYMYVCPSVLWQHYRQWAMESIQVHTCRVWVHGKRVLTCDMHAQDKNLWHSGTCIQVSLSERTRTT